MKKTELHIDDLRKIYYSKASNYTQENLDRILKNYPNLTYSGFENSGAIDYAESRNRLADALKEFQFCCVHFTFYSKTKSTYKRQFSHYYKIEVEHIVKSYIAEGSVIAAALHMGLIIKQLPGSRDAGFNLGQYLYIITGY